MEHPHDGHRERLRDRIRTDGIQSLAPHEVLEYLLFPFVPRRNTNEIAHDLLHRFGSIDRVFGADYEALRTTAGMTDNAALFLAQMPSITVLYKTEHAKHNGQNYLDPNVAAVYLNELIGNHPSEMCAALGVDVKGNLLGTVCFDSDAGDHVSVDVRKLVKELLQLRAVGVVVAHNHPSGDVHPSPQDLEAYRCLTQALAPLSIKLMDCIIVGGGKAYSMLGEGGDPHAQSGHEIDAGEANESEYNLLFNRNKK